jgi:predicted O-methyltransferase YrrM
MTSPAYLHKRLAQVRARITAPPRLQCAEMVKALFSNATSFAVEALRSELRADREFLNSLDTRMMEKRKCGIGWVEWREFLYIAVRLSRPKTIVETGVFDGVSSAMILRALNKNQEGTLLSIDLPATETIEGSTNFMPSTTLPIGCQPGWIVPNYLRDRYRLVLGDSRTLLPVLLGEHKQIDIFFHDSLHTFEHQYFEYSQAWPYLLEGGLLFSDDIFWSPAFDMFCKEQKRHYVRLEGFGAVRK